MKTCSNCKAFLPLDCFHRRSVSPDGLAYNCKTCSRVLCNEWKKKNPSKNKILIDRQIVKRKASGRQYLYRRNKQLKRNFGITLEQYNQMLQEQGGVCAICKTNEWRGRHGVPVVDHDHATGRVRGILCAMCNSGLGYFKDKHSTVQAAANYLQE